MESSEKSDHEKIGVTMSEKSTESEKDLVAEIHKNENEKNEKNGVADVEAKEDEYPHGIKLALLTMSIMLAVFIMSLDTTVIGERYCCYSIFSKLTHDYSDGSADNNIDIPQHRRYRLVQQRISPSPYVSPTHIRKTLLLLQRQISLSRRPRYL